MAATIQKAGHPRYLFCVLYQSGGCQRRRYFKTRRLAADWKARHEAATAHIAPSDASATPEEHRAIIHARAHKVPLMEAIEHWRKTAGRSQGITITDLCQRRLEECAGAGHSHNYTLQVAAFMKRIIAEIGDVTLAEATPERLARFIHGRGKPASQRYYKAILSGVFAAAMRSSIATHNPAGLVKIARVAKEKMKPPAILKPAQAMDWLAAVTAEAPTVLPGVAIGLFAGLRAAEVARLDWSEVRLARGFIEVTAGKSKTRTRRLVDLMPNLVEWLAPHAQDAGPVMPPGVRTRLALARRALGWHPPRNASRHSFVSYHLALFGDVAKTELQAGHDRAVLFQHYRELVTEGEAAEWFSIVP